MAKMRDEMEKLIKNFENGKGYVINPDNFKKIIFIMQKAKMRVPILLIGESGCGKTYIIKFIARVLLKESFKIITIHAGYSHKQLLNEIKEIVEEGKKLLRTNEFKRYWVFFDELNTSPLQDLIAEVMLDRYCSFLDDPYIPKTIVFVAAGNPYRIKKFSLDTGIIADKTAILLTHNVLPLPDSLMDCVINFHQLSNDVEKTYIINLLKNHDKKQWEDFRDCVIDCLLYCHKFYRSKEDESSVSLRDIQRFIKIKDWFAKHKKDFNLTKIFQNNSFYDEHTETICAFHICYLLRSQSEDSRKDLKNYIIKR